MQGSDGNVVLYDIGTNPPTALWRTNTLGVAPSLAFTADGDLVVSEGAQPKWTSHTNGSSAATLVVQGDCNLVLYTAAGHAVWSSMSSPCPVPPPPPLPPLPPLPPAPPSSRVDASSLQGKLLFGYQGWFDCAGSGSPNGGGKGGWVHWSPGSSPRANLSTFDLWPAMDEYPAADRVPTPELLARGGGGGAMELFSSFAKSTQDVHFRWMREYLGC